MEKVFAESKARGHILLTFAKSKGHRKCHETKLGDEDGRQEELRKKNTDPQRCAMIIVPILVNILQQEPVASNLKHFFECVIRPMTVMSRLYHDHLDINITVIYFRLQPTDEEHKTFTLIY